MEKLNQAVSPTSGLVFDIQGFSVHDGPGCRTLVFLSGCPLRCAWCANPEGLVSRQRLMFRENKCRSLRRCRAACPHGAISIEAKHPSPPTIDRAICATCRTFECASGCFSEALTVSGRNIDVSELMTILERDRNFWGPGGGVTFGGGEPLAQRDFVFEALHACRDRLMHTAMESCAHVPTGDLISALELLEWIFIDLKHMDPKRHLEGTGTDNRLILDNIASVASSGWGGRLVVRIPVVPGFNDDTANIRATAAFLADHHIGEAHLVPFHRLGASKYQQLGLDWPYADTPSPTTADLQRHAQSFTKRGILCHLGADTPF